MYRAFKVGVAGLRPYDINLYNSVS